MEAQGAKYYEIRHCAKDVIKSVGLTLGHPASCKCRCFLTYHRCQSPDLTLSTVVTSSGFNYFKTVVSPLSSKDARNKAAKEVLTAMGRG